MVQIPLAARLERRLRARQREREELLVRAIEASDIERRRIAADLHDGAVQDLAGISYSLDVAAGQAETTPRTDLRDLLRQAGKVTRESMRQLRSLLVEIYPPNLHDTGLEAAIEDLLAPLRQRGIQVELATDGIGRLAPESEQLIFRTAQEALPERNRPRKGFPRDGRPRAAQRNGRRAIRDDGEGFDTGRPPVAARKAISGSPCSSTVPPISAGVSTVESKPGEGTAILLEIPTP